jgi:hypothetical protein
MRKINAITTFVLEINSIIDKGKNVSIDEVNSHIENMGIVEWIENKFPFYENGVDFSLFGDKEKEFVTKEYESIWLAYNGQEQRKWGITNNGLCLLVAWGIEIMRSVEDELL